MKNPKNETFVLCLGDNVFHSFTEQLFYIATAAEASSSFQIYKNETKKDKNISKSYSDTETQNLTKGKMLTFFDKSNVYCTGKRSWEKISFLELY